MVRIGLHIKENKTKGLHLLLLQGGFLHILHDLPGRLHGVELLGQLLVCLHCTPKTDANGI